MHNLSLLFITIILLIFVKRTSEEKDKSIEKSDKQSKDIAKPVLKKKMYKKRAKSNRTSSLKKKSANNNETKAAVNGKRQSENVSQPKSRKIPIKVKHKRIKHGKRTKPIRRQPAADEPPRKGRKVPVSKRQPIKPQSRGSYKRIRAGFGKKPVNTAKNQKRIGTNPMETKTMIVKQNVGKMPSKKGKGIRVKVKRRRLRFKSGKNVTKPKTIAVANDEPTASNIGKMPTKKGTRILVNVKNRRHRFKSSKSAGLKQNSTKLVKKSSGPLKTKPRPKKRSAIRQKASKSPDAETVSGVDVAKIAEMINRQLNESENHKSKISYGNGHDTFVSWNGNTIYINDNGDINDLTEKVGRVPRPEDPIIPPARYRINPLTGIRVPIFYEEPSTTPQTIVPKLESIVSETANIVCMMSFMPYNKTDLCLASGLIEMCSKTNENGDCIEDIVEPYIMDKTTYKKVRVFPKRVHQKKPPPGAREIYEGFRFSSCAFNNQPEECVHYKTMIKNTPELAEKIVSAFLKQDYDPMISSYNVEEKATLMMKKFFDSDGNRSCKNVAFHLPFLQKHFHKFKQPCSIEVFERALKNRNKTFRNRMA